MSGVPKASVHFGNTINFGKSQEYGVMARRQTSNDGGSLSAETCTEGKSVFILLAVLVVQIGTYQKDLVPVFPVW